MSGDLTARDVELILANVLFEESETCMGSVEERRIARVMLAALAAAGWRIERDDQWEWGVDWPDEDWTVEKPSEAHARAYEGQKCIHGQAIVVVRRRPAGDWEVAPDA